MYSYENIDLGTTNQLWTIGGKISFVSTNDFTVWHGTFEHDGSMINARFDCKGREDKLKIVRLVRLSQTVWEGFDYRSRRVRLTFLRQYEADEETGFWE